MHLLLDTHAWLWFVKGDGRLSDDASRAIQDDRNRLYLSVASVWEVAIKTAIKKMTWNEPLEVFVAREVKPFRILQISIEHAIVTSSLPLHHRDPFDRILAAQALRRRLTLVSRDSVFDSYGVTRRWEG